MKKSKIWPGLFVDASLQKGDERGIMGAIWYEVMSQEKKEMKVEKIKKRRVKFLTCYENEGQEITIKNRVLTCGMHPKCKKTAEETD